MMHMNAAGGDRYYDRGDPAAVDWYHTDLTMDGAYHDLDLSAIVPAGATLVLLRMAIVDAVLDTSLSLRKNGNANDYNRAKARIIVINRWHYMDAIVSCDADRVIEYNASAAFDGINLTVAGWWA